MLLVLSLASYSQNNIFDHVEPPFWWSGMVEPKLQIVLHGENISHLEPKIDYPGIYLEQTISVENGNYLFLNLILDDVKPGFVPIIFHNPTTREIVTVNYEFKERKDNSASRVGFSTEDVIYLMMPDRFANGDTENDSSDEMKEQSDRKNPDGRHGGDLKGITEHLDYINDMGFTALWLNPFFENNNPSYSYHGYAITDFYNTDVRLGTNADYLKMVSKSHELGMKVIMDYILNHSSLYHWFIEDLPMKNWIHQHDEFTRSNFRAPVVQDPYASEYDKQKMLTGWFDHHMPDFDQRNELLNNYLIQNTIWWIEYADLDGVRLDTQPYPYKEMVSEWAERIFAEYPNFNIVGEAWLQKEGITAYFQESKRGKGYDSHIPSVTDFPFYFAVAQAFTENPGWTSGMARLYYIFAQDNLYPNAMNNLIFLDNHDINRFYNNVGKNLAHYKQGVTLLLTTRGIPQVYYGTEILMTGEEHKGHGFIREDYPGGWMNDKVNAFTGAGLSTDQLEAQEYMRKLLQWRKQSMAIKHGSLVHFLPENEVYVYFRKYKKESVMVIINNSSDSQVFDTNRYKECLYDTELGFDVMNDREIKFDDFTIKPYSSYIISFSNDK